MENIDEELKEIITPTAYGFEQYAETECPECMFDFGEAKRQLKALIAEREAAVRAATLEEVTIVIDQETEKVSSAINEREDLKPFLIIGKEALVAIKEQLKAKLEKKGEDNGD